MNLLPTTVARLAAGGNLVGIKDSSGDLDQTVEYIEYIEKTPAGFAVFRGRDELILPSLEWGAVDGVAATGNVAPDVTMELHHAFVQGDRDQQRARRAQAKLSLLRRMLTLGTFPSVLKAAMTMIGEPVGPSRPPVKPLAEAQHAALRQVLAHIGLTVTV